MDSLTRRSLLTGVGALTLTAATPCAEAATPAVTLPLVGPATAPDVHVMTCNVRYDKAGTRRTSPDHWPRRAPVLQDLLRAEQPGLLGTQEALDHQLPPIREALPDGYQMLGSGRDGGTRGEYCAMFYDAGRFTVGEWRQRWISDTPDMPSPTYGNTLPRIIVWAAMTDTATGRDFLWLNTHLDNVSDESRRRGSEMMLQVITEHPGLPVVVTGDFNSAAGDSVAWTTLVTEGGLADSWAAAQQRLTPAYGTFTDYRAPRVGGERIDWILLRGSTVRAAAVNTWTRNGQAPSDHAPVQALIRMP
ncbi:endonuclease/exonuclease/phosphatase family protein [Arsenicicoccus dermatophilus]|uniref:endonuclease/exonuclease/phosphatase family protein n=1 Tax=Arsenicicoccus dermatophilus TaxID=1076331 RepID=UPI0039174931